MPLTRQQFDKDMGELDRSVAAMGTAAGEMVRDAIHALLTVDAALAASIIRRDDAIDRMEQEIETQCNRLLALQQPMASDLRLIGTILKIITDIERIADHAVNLSKIVRRLDREERRAPPIDVSRLGALVGAMLTEALEAFAGRDLGSVDQVIRDDAVADRLYSEMRRDLQEAMKRDAGQVIQASYLLFVVHYLERIADHCTSIVERVAFLETGYLKDKVYHGEDGGEPVYASV